MSDSPYSVPTSGNTSTHGSPAASGRSPGSPQGATSTTKQVSELAGELKKQAVDAAEHATQQVKEQASELADRAKTLASDAGDKLRNAAEEQKNSGADFVSGIAGAIRRAASEFDGPIPQAGQYIRQAAQQVDSASDALRRRDLNQLVGSVQDFARRQPTAFLGATVLAGFAAVRFLKSATASQNDPSNSSQPERRGFSQSGMSQGGQGYTPPPTGMTDRGM